METYLIAAAVSTVYVLVLVLCVPEHMQRKTRKNGVYLPGFFFWVGVVGGGVFTVLGWFGADADIFTATVFAAFVALSPLLMLGWRNCYLVYDEEGFTQKNLIGMYRRFRYEDVTGWCSNSTNPVESTVYALGKKVSFNLLCANSAGFLVALKDGYRRTHGGKMLPGHRQTEYKTGFRAHVRNPGEFLFVFILLIVFVVGMGGWCAWMIWTPLDGSDCETLSLIFTDWTVEDHYLILTAEGYDEVFEIRGFPEYASCPEALLEQCDGETVFTAYARRIDGDGDPDYYWLQSLEDEGIAYLTLEDATAQRRSELPMLMMFFGGFLSLVLILAGLMYLVGCNPERFPKWLVKGLFKEGYIDY